MIPVPAERYAIFDPAGKKRPHESRRTGRSRSAYLTWGVDDYRRIWVLEAWACRDPVERLMERWMASYETWTPRHVFVEDVALQHHIADSLVLLARQQGVVIPTVPVKPPQGLEKDYRIETWIREEESKGKLIIADHLDELLAERAAFPTGQTKDLVDCLAYACHLTPQRALSHDADARRADDGVRDYLLASGMSPEAADRYMAERSEHHGRHTSFGDQAQRGRQPSGGRW